MELVNSSGVVITDAVFRAQNPLTSFPATLQAADVEPYGLFIVQPTTQPTAPTYYTLTEGPPSETTPGVWVQTWVQSAIPLATAQATQSALLQAAYEAAITAPVSYTTAAGTASTFKQDATAKSNLQDAILASQKSESWPINLWLDSTGTSITPFTYADLQGLAAAMEAVDAPDFQGLLALLSQVNTATTVDEVAEVVWSNSTTTQSTTT
jgi:hypothetical protein